MLLHNRSFSRRPCPPHTSGDHRGDVGARPSAGAPPLVLLSSTCLPLSLVFAYVLLLGVGCTPERCTAEPCHARLPRSQKVRPTVWPAHALKLLGRSVVRGTARRIRSLEASVVPAAGRWMSGCLLAGRRLLKVFPAPICEIISFVGSGLADTILSPAGPSKQKIPFRDGTSVCRLSLRLSIL